MAPVTRRSGVLRERGAVSVHRSKTAFASTCCHAAPRHTASAHARLGSGAAVCSSAGRSPGPVAAAVAPPSPAAATATATGERSGGGMGRRAPETSPPSRDKAFASRGGMGWHTPSEGSPSSPLDEAFGSRGNGVRAAPEASPLTLVEGGHGMGQHALPEGSPLSPLDEALGSRGSSGGVGVRAPPESSLSSLDEALGDRGSGGLTLIGTLAGTLAGEAAVDRADAWVPSPLASPPRAALVQGPHSAARLHRAHRAHSALLALRSHLSSDWRRLLLAAPPMLAAAAALHTYSQTTGLGLFDLPGGLGPGAGLAPGANAWGALPPFSVETLTSLPSTLWRAYCASLEFHPAMTKVATGLVGAALGDLTAQALGYWTELAEWSRASAEAGAAAEVAAGADARAGAGAGEVRAAGAGARAAATPLPTLSTGAGLNGGVNGGVDGSVDGGVGGGVDGSVGPRPEWDYDASNAARLIAWAALTTPGLQAWYMWLDDSIMPSDPTSPVAVSLKVLADQGFLTPITTALFFVFMRMAEDVGEGGHLGDARALVQAECARKASPSTHNGSGNDNGSGNGNGSAHAHGHAATLPPRLTVQVQVEALIARAGDALRSKYFPTMRACWTVWPLAHAVNFAIVPSSMRILYINVVAVAWTTFLVIQASSSDTDACNDRDERTESDSERPGAAGAAGTAGAVGAASGAMGAATPAAGGVGAAGAAGTATGAAGTASTMRTAGASSAGGMPADPRGE
ncbi:hypothetical protein FOA52_008679 [Chlamydomonas sp. UWO 241]|nr:hypothetical protein FOA52_008679 [Chlamydomonas sp. UWO 241]